MCCPDDAIWDTVGSGLIPGSPQDGEFPEQPDPDPENPEKPEIPFPPSCAQSKGQIWAKHHLNIQNQVSHDQNQIGTEPEPNRNRNWN